MEQNLEIKQTIFSTEYFLQPKHIQPNVIV